MAAFPWSVLGLAPTGDSKAIRSAYAARVKAMDLDADVAGYAALRDARDTALRMARTMPAQADAAIVAVDTETLAALDDHPLVIEPEPQDEPEPQAGHAPPPPSADWAPEPALTTPSPSAADAFAQTLTPDFSGPASSGDTGEDPADDLLPHLDAAFGAPLLGGYDTAAAVGTESLQSPFVRLAARLEADGDLDEAQALELLGAVLDAIHRAPIDRQAQLEHWLSEQLAQHWPRSAPLLEPATAALGWEREWGRIDARADIEYLGARLRGRRFAAKVEHKDHRYHRAWKELSRPGKAGLTRHLRAQGGDVRGLLAGIRRNFPELEDRFDPQRVASWEKVRSWPTGLLVFGGLVILGFLVSLADGKPEAQHRAYRAAVEEIFGAGNDAEWLNRNQPDLASALAMRAVITPGGEVDRPATIAADLALVRERTYLNGRRLDGADFDTAMRLRLALLEAARADSPAACAEMMRTHAPPATTRVPPEVRTQERRFAAQLAERTALGPPASAQGSSATVPAELANLVLERTGLNKDQVKAAMRDENDPNRCLTTIALLKAALDWHGPERHDILMTL